MKNQLMKFRKSILFFARTMMFAILVSLFAFIYFTEYTEALFYWWGNVIMIISYVAIMFSFTMMYGGFNLGFWRKNELAYSIAVSSFFTNFIIYIQLCLIAEKILSPLGIIALFFMQIVVGFILTQIFNKLYFYLYPARNVAMVCHSKTDAQAIANKVRMIKERYKLRCVLPDDLDFEKITKVISKFESILIYDVDTEVKNKLIDYCYNEGKRVYIVPTVQDLVIANSHTTQIFDCPVLLCKNRGMSIEQRFIKRAIDIVLSALGLIVASPFLLATAIAIRLYDHHPALFKQERLTENGKVFTLYKFRSMRIDAEADGVARLATSDDDRITPIGKFIRKTRLDEIPQLFNVLKGDMSIVGPRPERPEIASEYEKIYPEFKYRLKVKAGITGNAQIQGKYNTSPRDKLLLDLAYIQQYSLLLDFKLMFLTIKIFFMSDSAEGFDKQKTDISQIEFIKKDSE